MRFGTVPAQVPDACVEEILATAAAVVRTGTLSPSGHGSISLRMPSGDEALCTTAPSLRDVDERSLVRLRLDDEVPDELAIHLVVHRERPEIGCVIHTHAPFATAFAAAGRPIGCWSEPMIEAGLGDGVPVVPYVRPGSAHAVTCIRRMLGAGRRAVLLANHGVLVLHETAAEAVSLAALIEEAAQLGLRAAAIGGPVEIPGRLRQLP